MDIQNDTSNAPSAQTVVDGTVASEGNSRPLSKLPYTHPKQAALGAGSKKPRHQRRGRKKKALSDAEQKAANKRDSEEINLYLAQNAAKKCEARWADGARTLSLFGS